MGLEKKNELYNQNIIMLQFQKFSGSVNFPAAAKITKRDNQASHYFAFTWKNIPQSKKKSYKNCPSLNLLELLNPTTSLQEAQGIKEHI